LVICNEEHRFSVAEQFRLNNTPNSGIVLEPVGRNTAPAIALAAMLAIRNGDDPLLLVLAADHVIKDQVAFCQAVTNAMPLAEQNQLVTFGIVPTAPETGYGYIQRGDALASSLGFDVAQFVEKPNLTTAQDYIATGQYYWNSGMFMFKASTYLQELKIHSPAIFAACEAALVDVTHDADFIRINKAAFEACPDDSIDYAFM
jgi:mannose-1-phosphate guanylyltransferase